MNPIEATGIHTPTPRPAESVVDLNATPPDSGTLAHGPVQTTPRPTHPLVPGYEIERELGRGGMGVVYLARQTGLNRTVALKMILNTALAGVDEVVRFLAEAEAVAKLNHPNIVQIHQSGTAGGYPYFALEYVEGGTLADRVRDQPLEPRRAAEVVEQLAGAMAASHAQGVVHRDLKPANVLMTRLDVPKIADFGLAKRLDIGSGLTVTGQIMGTPSYMAPEQALGRNESVNESTDVYALGAILYHLITGRPPFLGPTVHATLAQVIDAEPVPPRRQTPSVPRDLETICLKCLRKDPRDRYPSAQALGDDLRAFLAGRHIAARPVSRSERAARWVKRNPGWAAMVALLTLSLVAGMAASLYYAEQARASAVNEAAKARDLAQSVNELTEERERTQRAFARNQVLLAEATFDGIGSAQRANEQLDAVPERFRGWEYDFLRRKYRGALFALEGHSHEVTCVAYSSDGGRIASGAFDGTARVWDARDGRLLRSLQFGSSVTSLAWSPDGSRIAAACGNGGLRVWNADAADLSRELPGRVGETLGVAWSPDGARLATASRDGIVRVRDAESGADLLRVNAGSLLWCLAWSADGTRLAAGTQDFRVLVWEARGGAVMGELLGAMQPILGLNFSPDGSRLAGCSLDGTTRLWDLATRAVRLELRGRGANPFCVAFSPDGGRLVTGERDRVARVWDARTGGLLAELKGHVGFPRAAAFSPDGRFVVTGSSDGTLRVWRADSGSGDLTLRGPAHGLYGSAVSPSGRFVAAASGEVRVRVWDARSGATLRDLPLPSRVPRGLTFFDDSRLFVACGEVVRLIDWRSGATAMDFRGGPAEAFSAAVSPNRRQVAVGAQNGAIAVWDAATGRLLRPLTGPGREVSALAFAADGRLVSASPDDGLRVWDPESGATLGRRTLAEQATALAFAPDGRLFVGCFAGAIRVFDAALETETANFRGHAETVLGLGFSPDGRLLASASVDKSARLWDATTGTPLLELRCPLDVQPGIAFTPDGSRLVAASMDNFVRIWDSAAPLGVEGETAFRRALTRPDPDWHRDRINLAARAGDPFAITVEVDLYHRAMIRERLDRGDFDGAFLWSFWGRMFQQRPPVPAAPEVLPMPRK